MLLRTDTVRALHADTRGLSVVEYAILAVLIAVIGLIAWSLFGEEVEQKVVLATEQMGGVGQEGSRIPSAGGGGGGAGGNAAGGAGAPGTAGGGGVAGSDQELAAAHGSASGGGGSATPAGASSDTHAAGIVSRSNGGGSVYVAPGADADDSGVWFTLLGIIVFFLLGIVVFAKMKGRAAR
ncbi:MAG: hypothetical protein H6721_26385 [Sandaracinus sp.]|nr:hypothetical protein [Myxococcales bacterium]MCB9622698.1 hypothetical protein [Sandaracinus sp.]MCB9635662.1 hypothetical protein [Sandaracinus sp.]